MSDKTENHTIKLLQEMRQEINAQFSDVAERFDDMNIRIDGLTHIMTLMAGHSHDLDERVERLEEVVKAE
jgi:hypothetical protein